MGCATGRSPIHLTDCALVFFHIQKCAGNSLLDLLQAFYPPRQTLKAHLLHPNAPEIVRPMHTYRLIAGHNTVDDIAALGLQNPLWMTMLRDPLDRVVSLYHFWRSHHPDYIEKAGLRGPRLARALPLEAFIESEQLEAVLNVRNGQAGQFLNGLRAPVGLPEDQFMEQVLARLSRFAFIGIMEQFEASMDLMCHRFGWCRPDRTRRINDTRRNVEERQRYVKEPRPKPDAACRERIRELNRVDVAIYAYARKRLDRELAEMRASPAAVWPAGAPPRLLWRIRRRLSDLADTGARIVHRC